MRGGSRFDKCSSSRALRLTQVFAAMLTRLPTAGRLVSQQGGPRRQGGNTGTPDGFQVESPSTLLPLSPKPQHTSSSSPGPPAKPRKAGGRLDSSLHFIRVSEPTATLSPTFSVHSQPGSQNVCSSYTGKWKFIPPQLYKCPFTNMFKKQETEQELREGRKGG